MKILTENETMIPPQVLFIVEKNNLHFFFSAGKIGKDRQIKNLKILVFFGPKA